MILPTAWSGANRLHQTRLVIMIWSNASVEHQYNKLEPPILNPVDTKH